jgi:hypothetical protein
MHAAAFKNDILILEISVKSAVCKIPDIQMYTDIVLTNLHMLQVVSSVLYNLQNI